MHIALFMTTAHATWISFSYHSSVKKHSKLSYGHGWDVSLSLEYFASPTDALLVLLDLAEQDVRYEEEEESHAHQPQVVGPQVPRVIVRYALFRKVVVSQVTGHITFNQASYSTLLDIAHKFVCKCFV